MSPNKLLRRCNQALKRAPDLVVRHRGDGGGERARLLVRRSDRPRNPLARRVVLAPPSCEARADLADCGLVLPRPIAHACSAVESEGARSAVIQDKVVLVTFA